MATSLRTSRRLGRVAATAALALLAAACGSSDSDSPGASSTQDAGGSTDKEVKVALVLPFTGIAFMQHQIDGAETAAEDLNVDLSVVTGQGPDPAAQVKLMNDAITAGAEGLVVMPIAPALFTRPLTDATDKGIPVSTITIHAEPGVNQAYVGSSEYEFVEPSIKHLADKWGADATGKVVLGTCSTGTGILEDRTEAQKKYFAQYLPNIQVEGPFVTAQEAGKNYSVWQSVISSNGDARLFLGNCPFDGASLAKAKAAAGGAQWEAASLGVGPEMIDGLRSGDLLFGTDEVEWARAYVAVQRVAEALRSGEGIVNGWINTGSDLVTPDNVDEVATRYDAKGADAKPLFEKFIEMGTTADAQPLDALKP